MTARSLFAAVLTAGLGCIAYGTLVERRWYRLRRVQVTGLRSDRGAATTAAPLRILHVSDIHLNPPQEHRTRFLARVAEEDVDLVVATGDLIGAAGAENAVGEALAPLTADGTPGLLVLGSNDLFAPVPKNPLRYLTDPDDRVRGQPLDTARMVAGLEAHGWRLLRNEPARVTTAAGPVAVAAIDDPHLQETVLPPVADIRPDTDGAVLRLGVVHAPYTAALDRLVDAGAELLLAGHTHGGQVRLPGVGALVNNCDLPLSQSRGLSTWRGARLHVSPGLGHGRFAPFRFACRPEATILEIA